MRINITARRFRLSEKIKKHTENEISRLKKYFDGILEADVILSWEKKDRIAEINIQVYGTVLSAHERSENMIKSIDLAVEKMERQIKKYKSRLKEHKHEKAGAQ